VQNANKKEEKMGKILCPTTFVILFLCFGTARGYDLLEYFPLTQGSYWIYDKIEDGAVIRQKGTVIDGSVFQPGVGTAIRISYYDSDYSLTSPSEAAYVKYDTEALYWHGNRNWDWDEEEPLGLYLFSPPMAIKRNLEFGQSSISTYVINRPDDLQVPITTTVTLLGIETVTVPAGTFPDCLKLSIVEEGEDGDAYYAWWAKGVGEVMTLENTDEVTKLTSHHVAGQPPEAPILSLTTASTRVAISWDEVSGATSYVLYYAPYPGADTIFSLPLGAERNVVYDLWSGAAFYVAITACNASGCSGYSNIEHFVLP